MRTITAAALAAVLLGCAACADSRARGERQAIAAVSGCPAGASGSPGARAMPRVGTVTLRLPPQAYRSRVEYNRARIGESWTINPGMRVGWELSREHYRPRQLTADDLHPVTCREVIGGEPVDIVTYFGSTAYVPGQYLVAT